MFCIIIRKLVFCVVFCTSLYRLSWSLFIILTVLSSVLIIVCHFDCCIVCPDHCLSFWLLYRLSWSLFVILTVVLSVLIIVCHFDCCIVCPLINVLWLPLVGVCKPFWNDMCLLKPQFYLCTMYMLVYITFHFHIRNGSFILDI